MVQARHSSSPAVRKLIRPEQRVGGGDQALQSGFLQAVAGQILALLVARQFGELGFDLAADGGHGGVRAAGQRTVAVFLLALVQAAGVLFADIEHVEHRLLREELEAADALLVIGIELQLAQRLVGFEQRLAFHQQLEFAVELGILDLLAIFVQALQALLHHHEVAEDQLGLDVFQIAQRVHGALLVRNGLVGEEAQHVGERVDHAQARE